jgi:hypothetical protein
MRFFNNKIPTGTSKKSFADLIKEATSKPQTVKTAAAAAPEAKTANISNFGDKKAEPFGKKDKKSEKGEKDCKKGEEGCDEKEASVKEEPIVTAKTKVAEQKDDYEEERRTDVHHVEGTKDQQSGKGNGEPEDNGAVTAKESKKEATAKPEAKKETTKKAATVERSEKDNPTRTDVHHQENTNDQESKGTNGEPEDCKEAKAKAAPKTTAKAEVKVEAKKVDPKVAQRAKLVADVLKSNDGWKKFANLAPKQKNMLRDYFTLYWPAEFVDALLADK